jgi:hypothetical protein
MLFSTSIDVLIVAFSTHEKIAFENYSLSLTSGLENCEARKLAIAELFENCTPLPISTLDMTACFELVMAKAVPAKHCHRVLIEACTTSQMH